MSLCEKYGFCLPPLERRRLYDAAPQDADVFLAAIYAAEGLDPLLDRRLHELVRAHVVRAFRPTEA